jgi:hypothetical protein
MKKATSRRRGNVIVLIAVMLIPIMGVVAIALDGGVLQQDRRMAQAAADAAALAAAEDLYANYLGSQGFDVTGTAKSSALGIASANGFSNDGVNSKVTVNIPPTSGLHQGLPGYAEVIIEYYQSRLFSNLWGGDKLTVRARAVAIGKWAPFRDGIMVLDPTSSGSLSANGGASINVVNADVIVDSNAPDAATAIGGTVISAPNFYITGVPGTSTTGGGTFAGNIVDNQQPTPDPLANIPVPDPSTMTNQGHSGNFAGQKTYYIQPGVYEGGIKVSGSATLVMAPGIYYMQNGGFSFTGLGNLVAEGVMIYTNPTSNSDVININGNGSIDFTPPTSGVYQGMALWQARSSTNTVYITGNGASALYGTVYAQHGTLNVSGNGTQDVLGSQYVSYDVTVGGNGSFYIQWRQDLTVRTRYIYLVE